MSVVDRLRLCLVTLVAIASVASAADTPAPSTATVHNVHPVAKFAHVAALLNLGQGTVRIVAVVPTGSSSSAGVVDTLASIVQGTPSKRLRVYVILQGENDADSPLHAAVLAGRATDPRLVFFWDPTGDVARAWHTTSSACAWLYDTAVKFGDAPPAAALTVEASPPGRDARLAGAALRGESSTMIRRVEAKVAQANGGQ